MKATDTQTGISIRFVERFAAGLPLSNPDCVHLWGFDVVRLGWRCSSCGYEVGEDELRQKHEGEV